MTALGTGRGTDKSNRSVTWCIHCPLMYNRLLPVFQLRTVKVDSLPQFPLVSNLGVARLGASDLEAPAILGQRGSHLQV